MDLTMHFMYEFYLQMNSIIFLHKKKYIYIYINILVSYDFLTIIYLINNKYKQ